MEKLTSHMITPIILLNTPLTLPIRTLLRHLPDQPPTRLVLLLPYRRIRPIIVLRARLPAMPSHAMRNAMRRFARYACKFRTRGGFIDDLARCTSFCHAPCESWDGLEGCARAEDVVAPECVAGAEVADVGVGEEAGAFGADDLVPEFGGELCGYPVFEAAFADVGGVGTCTCWGAVGEVAEGTGVGADDAFFYWVSR